MKCEVCGEEYHKRRRLSDNRLVCFNCWMCFNLPQSAADIIRWQNVRIMELNTELRERSKLRIYNSPFSAIPPQDILRKATVALEISGNYQAFSDVLADYYGVGIIKYNVSPTEVSENAIACYHPGLNKVTSKEKTISHYTAFHEFYHALQDLGIVNKNNWSEKDAENYALACEKLLNKE